MRKVDVINKIASETGIPKVDILVTLETFFDTVKDTLASGESIHIRGFGSFGNNPLKEYAGEPYYQRGSPRTFGAEISFQF